jgi:hypothetical protein
MARIIMIEIMAPHEAFLRMVGFEADVSTGMGAAEAGADGAGGIGTFGVSIHSF